MTVTVGPDKKGTSTHHIKLTDSSSTEIGLICCNGRGDRLAQVAVNPYPNMASQLRQGRGKHADRVPPFEDIPLSDFSGGMCMLHHDEDASKYLDGTRIDTSRMGEVVHGGLETYTTGLRDFDESWPGNVTWASMYASPGTVSRTVSFAAGASYTAASAVLLLKKVGTPTGNITVTLSNSDGGTAVSKVLVVGTACLTDLVSERVEFTFTATKALTSGTTYKITIAYAGGSATSYVQVAVDGSSNPYYRVLDATGDFGFIPFEYLGGFYGITTPDDGSVSKLYLLGDRGCTDANTGALTTLIDATKTWTVNEWAGNIVRMVGGMANREEQPWRTIVSNTKDTLTVTPAFTVTHSATYGEYVIYGDEWKLKQTLSARANDIAVVQDKVYISFGEATLGTTYYTRRFREQNVSGTWTETLDTEDNDASGSEQMIGVYNPSWKYPSPMVYDLWQIKGSSRQRTQLAKYQVPRYDEDLTNIIGTLCSNNRAWADTTYTNAAPNVTYNGSVVVVDAAFGIGKCAHIKLDAPVDVTYCEAIMLSLFVTDVGGGTDYATAGDITIVLADSTGAEDEYNLDGTTGLAHNLLIFLKDPTVATADQRDITNIYWKINSDEGAVNIVLYGPILMTGDRNYYYDMYREFPWGLKVNTLINYAGGAGQPVEKPWLLCNKGAFFIEDGAIKKIPLGELEELEHSRSGEGATVADVYLYFNMGETIQRYYAGRLDNVGPDKDYGLPEARRGIPCSMAAYPGKVLAAIDAGTGTSSVIYNKNHGWHELYRGIPGNRIRKIHVVGRADTVDRVYIQEGADILWVPISLNSQTDTDYEYVWESVLETSRIYGGLRETEKYYHAITLVTESLSTTNQYMQVDYRTSESSTWTQLVSNFITSPRQRQALVSTNNVSGRWIQFRIRSYTNDRTKTPKLVSAVIDSLERLQVNNMFSYTVRLDKSKALDMQGTEESLTGVAKLTQLETWVDSPLPLTLNTNSSFEDGKLVFLEGITKRVAHNKVDDMDEVRIINLNLIEVS